MLFSAARTVQISPLGGQNNLLEEGRLLRSRICCPLTSEGEKSLLWVQECKHLDQRRQMVWKSSKGIHLCPTRTGSLNRGGGLQRYFSPTYNAGLSSLPWQLNNHSHLGSPSLSYTHDDPLSQRSTSGPDDPETQSSRVSLTTPWSFIKRHQQENLNTVKLTDTTDIFLLLSQNVSFLYEVYCNLTNSLPWHLLSHLDFSCPNNLPL